jgi:hypothetical protein
MQSTDCGQHTQKREEKVIILMTWWKIKLFSYVHKKKEKWQVALCGHVMIIMWIWELTFDV